ncbi:MAG: phenylalanine--tRNA ligase subunit beta [archaeon]|jgi:phenylalanyl-tRNA synthetase beta chain
MPTLDISKKDLEKMVGKKFSMTGLEEVLEYVKGEVDGVDGDTVKVDCKETNRPDLWSTEGIARDLKARMGIQKGIVKYKVEKSNVEIIVDKNLDKLRPAIAGAVVKGITIDEPLLLQMIQIQEKVCETFGRKRKEAAMGIYDFDIMKAPIYYKGFKDNEIEFVPLEWKVPMRPTEILSQHDKGKTYAHLLADTNVFPILIDSNNLVASMPPIINSNATGKVTEKTKNLFVEVTGFNQAIVEVALEVILMALADRGGKIYSCKINFPKTRKIKSTITPKFNTKKISFDKEQILTKTGLALKDNEIKSLLERARYNVKITGKKIDLEYSSYRKDIFHAVDVIEDLLISYGYNNIVPEKIEMDVKGSQRKEVLFYDLVREGCVGLGLQEVQTFNLTSLEIQSTKMNLENEKDSFVQLANPVSINYEIMRKRLTPQLLSFLSKNKSQEFPQNIFEIGTCLDIDESCENGVKQTMNLCGMLSSSNVEFTQIKSVLVSLCDYLGLEVKVKKSAFSFLSENSAELTINGKKGFIGELSKEVESNFSLKKPVVLFEFEL